LREIFRDLCETAGPLDDETQRLVNQLKQLKLSTPMAIPPFRGRVISCDAVRALPLYCAQRSSAGKHFAPLGLECVDRGLRP
jgi:hypothetical protein